MLHNNRDNEELKTSTSTTTTTTIEGNGTEPTNRTHFATSSAAASTAETSAGEEEINATAEGQLPPTTTAAAYRTELGETADALAASNAATAAESPAFDVQMRTQQRQKIKIYHDAKQTAVWRTDSLASNPSSTMCPDFAKSGAGEGTPPMGLPPRGIILSTAPSLLQRKSSDSSLTSSIARRVSFPDNELVTGYLEPANPWKQGVETM